MCYNLAMCNLGRLMRVWMSQEKWFMFLPQCTHSCGPLSEPAPLSMWLAQLLTKTSEMKWKIFSDFAERALKESSSWRGSNHRRRLVANKPRLVFGPIVTKEWTAGCETGRISPWVKLVDERRHRRREGGLRAFEDTLVLFFAAIWTLNQSVKRESVSWWDRSDVCHADTQQQKSRARRCRANRLWLVINQH